ncbi:MAG: hypothetical protein WCO22_10560 [Betaproteobacteria bacterium]
MKKIEEFLFKISGFKPRLREGQFIVNESILQQANEAYDNNDYETCTRIWEKYANLNNGVSLLRLAECYWKGLGLDIDIKKSFDLLQKGTLLEGGTQNYFNLGIAYQIGDFIEQNYFRSYFFYLCAFHYSLGDEIDLSNKSKERMNEVYQMLDEEDSKKADLLLIAIDKGYEPAGMSVAVELLDTL